MTLLRYPHPALSVPSHPVENFDSGLSDLVDDLKTHRDDVDHLGVNAFALAAPQIGVNLRVFIWRDPDETDVVVVNPEIVSRSGAQFAEEQCLSLLGQFSVRQSLFAPGLSLQVQRFDEITVRYQDEEGIAYQIQCDGILSRMFQHEVDHLDGLTILDRVSRPVRKQALRKWERIHAVKRPRMVAA